MYNKLFILVEIERAFKVHIIYKHCIIETFLVIVQKQIYKEPVFLSKSGVGLFYFLTKKFLSILFTDFFPTNLGNCFSSKVSYLLIG